MAAILKTASSFPFSKVDSVGIAVKLVSSSQAQHHIAILFKFDAEEPRLLHIGTPRGLICNNPDNDYLWFDLGVFFDSVHKEVVLTHIMKIVDANIDVGADLLYGFDTDARVFNAETGEFLPSVKQIGLTCATFVLEVFESCGYQLVKRDDWKMRDKHNIEWQNKMLSKFLLNSGLSAEYIQRQQKNVGNRRFLPEEVAASTLASKIPSCRKDVKSTARKIREELKP